jgi:hypothetical protein
MMKPVEGWQFKVQVSFVSGHDFRHAESAALLERLQALSVVDGEFEEGSSYSLVVLFKKKWRSTLSCCAAMRSKSDPGGGSRIAPSHFQIVSFYSEHLTTVPICCLFKIAQF